MLTEAIAEAKDHSHPLHITYMDASKAFDIAWHSTMLCKMYDRGIRDDLWLLLCNMYDGITTKIKWKGKISRPIDERQGIRQGGNISADQFKCHINPLLDRITHHNIGYQVGTIPVSAITCADDIAILSKSPSEEQVLLNVCSNDANRERYIFGEYKTKYMIMDDSTNPHTSTQLSLNGKPVEKVQTYTHLGILRDAKPTNLASTMDRISKARRRVYSLMGAGLHGLNGLNPSISLKLWHTYIASQLYYGLEAVGATAKQLQKIEEYQSQAFRQIQHLPSKTPTAAVYLLLGALPAEGCYDRRLQSFICNLIRSESTTEAKLVRRQAAIKYLSSSSMITSTRIALQKYKLPSIYDLINDPPACSSWKLQVKQATACTGWSNYNTKPGNVHH
jgi:hypothetical protein